MVLLPECKFGGSYKGRGAYAHILLNKNERQLLIANEEFRSEEACMVFFGGKLKFHTLSHHVNSSQIFCINVFAPLMVGENRSENMKSFLREMGIDLKGDIIYWDDEVRKENGNNSCTMLEYNPPGEDKTEVDFYVSTSEKEEVFFEIKYTEKEFGRASYNVDKSKKEDEWNGFYNEFCAKSRYLTKYSMNDFYKYFQINRNIGQITKEGRKFVVFLFPYSNPSLQFPYAVYSKMPRVKVCFSEQLGKLADKAFEENEALRLYYHNLVHRYFGF
jgi:hypothetical protein